MQKLFMAFNGPGVEKFAAGLAGQGFPAPTLMAWLVALTEFVGGTLLAIGLLTRPAALAVFIFMMVAVFAAHMPNGFFWTNKGVEYPLIWGIAALFFLNPRRRRLLGGPRHRPRVLTQAALGSAKFLLPFGRGDGVAPGAKPAALVMLGDPHVARDGVVHGGQESVHAAHEVPPSDIGFQKSRRELDEHAPGRDRDAAQLQVVRLLVRVAVQLLDLIAERPHGVMVEDTIQPSDPRARIERHPVVHQRGRIAAPVLAVEADGGERIGPRVRLLLPRKNFGDADLVGVAARPALPEQRADFPRQVRRRDLVGVDIEEPDMPALLLGETLLRPIARPRVVDDARPERRGDVLRAVDRARVHHDEVVRQIADGPNRRPDPVGLVLGDDEDGQREHPGTHETNDPCRRGVRGFHTISERWRAAPVSFRGSRSESPEPMNTPFCRHRAWPGDLDEESASGRDGRDKPGH